MAIGMSDSFRRHMLDQLVRVDPGETMRVQLHTAGGQIRPPQEPDDDTIGPVFASGGWVEFTTDPFAPLMATMLNSFSQVQASFASLAEAVNRADTAWATLKPAVHQGPDLFAPASSPQPWALHPRDKTSLELAVERWVRDNSPVPMTRWRRDEAPGACWSDLMSAIDELIEEP